MIGLEQMVGNKYFIIAYHVLRALKTSITKHEESQCNASRLYERLIVTANAQHVEVSEEYVVTTAPLATIKAIYRRLEKTLQRMLREHVTPRADRSRSLRALKAG